MNIVYVLSHDERFSGWSLLEYLQRIHFSKSLADAVGRMGHHVTLYKLHQDVDEDQTFEFRHFTLRVFPVSFRFPPFMKFGNDFPPRTLLQEINGCKPDIVHVFSYYIISFPYIAVNINRPIFTSYHGGRPYTSHYLAMPLIQWKVKRFIVPLRHEISTLINLGIPSNKILLLPHPCVDESNITEASTVTTREENSIVYVGRIPKYHRSMQEERQPQRILPILRSLHDMGVSARLTIVGDGEGISEIKALAKKLSLQGSVMFVDCVPHDEVFGYYRSHALSFCPMQLWDIDGLYGGSIQESLACGTPVVAFKAKQSLATEQRFGYLLDLDPQKAACQLRSILMNQDRLQEEGRQGQRFIRTRCTIQWKAEELVKIYGDENQE